MTFWSAEVVRFTLFDHVSFICYEQHLHCLYNIGGTNSHPGNVKYRKLVEDNKSLYISSNRASKSLKAMKVVKEWRSQHPPGRFLKLSETTGLYFDVGDAEAKTKTSQALREKRPSKLISEPNLHCDHSQPTFAQLATVEAKSMHNNMVQPIARDGKQNKSIVTHASSGLSILAECLFRVGIKDFKRLFSVTGVEEEFRSIKKAFFARILSLPRSDSTSFGCTCAAFEVLRRTFKKLRISSSSFVRLFNDAEVGHGRDLGYIHDMYAQCLSVPHGSYPSPGYFSMAATLDTPNIYIALSLGGCSEPWQCTKCKQAIPVGDIGIATEHKNGWKWEHMNCWRVPLDVWVGLSQPSCSSAVALRDVLFMDEVVIKGVSLLDYASQIELARYIMNRKNWVIARSGDRGEVAPTPEKEESRLKRASISDAAGKTKEELVRPLKKRSVVDICIGKTPTSQGAEQE